MDTEQNQQEQPQNSQQISYEDLVKSHKKWKISAIISFLLNALFIACFIWHISKCTGNNCGCFGATNWLDVRRDGISSRITLSNLQIGDYVPSINENGDIIWSKVWFINEHYGKHQMTQLLYSYNDGNGSGNLTLTDDHLLFRNDFELIRADTISIGDIVKVVDYTYSDKFINGKIVEIYNVLDYARSPITMHGPIVISSILSSSYTKSKANAQTLHKSAELFRDISSINTEFAAYLTNFFYNYIYKLFKAISLGYLSEYYATVPIVSVMFAAFVIQFFRRLK